MSHTLGKVGSMLDEYQEKTRNTLGQQWLNTGSMSKITQGQRHLPKMAQCFPNVSLPSGTSLEQTSPKRQ